MLLTVVVEVGTRDGSASTFVCRSPYSGECQVSALKSPAHYTGLPDVTHLPKRNGLPSRIWPSKISVEPTKGSASFSPAI